MVHVVKSDCTERLAIIITVPQARTCEGRIVCILSPVFIPCCHLINSVLAVYGIQVENLEAFLYCLLVARVFLMKFDAFHFLFLCSPVFVFIAYFFCFVSGRFFFCCSFLIF
jgi:hypothetical protein